MADHVAEVTPAGGSRSRGPHFLPGLARRFLAESLFKNSTFLVMNLGISALCGYGSLALLTRIFSTRDVGLTAAAVSGCTLITTVSLLGITYSVPRYLPTTKNRTVMINTLLTAVLLVTVLGSVIFLALPYAKNLLVLGGWLFGLAFVLATCIQAATTLLATVLIADRSSDKVATYGAIPNLLRLGAPPAFAFLGGLGCFLARVVSEVVNVVMYAGVLVRRGHRFRPALSMDVAREMAGFSTGMYIANIVGGLPQMLLPLIAISRVGSQQAAYWSIAISIAAILYSLPSTVTSALLPEVAFRPAERRQLLRRAALLIAGAVTPALVIAFICAPIALAVFGHGYTSGTLTAVRWLIAAGFITMLNAVTGAILFIAKKSTMMTIVNVVDAVIVIGMVAFWATNATDMAISWAVGDVGNTLLIGVFAFFAVRQVGGHWEKLGEGQVPSASEPPEALSETSQQSAAVDMLATVAEQQHGVETYRPYRPSLTDSSGLFSIVAVRAAERQRELAGGGSSPESPVFESVAETHRRALELLFSMAEQQRAAGIVQSEQHPSDGTVTPPDSNELF